MNIELDINLHLIWFHIYQLGIAFLLALPIAFDRDAESNGAGLKWSSKIGHSFVA